jgi:hypothetical protein
MHPLKLVAIISKECQLIMIPESNMKLANIIWFSTSKIDIMYPTKINSEKPLSNKIMTTSLQDILDSSKPSKRSQETIGGLDCKKM